MVATVDVNEPLDVKYKYFTFHYIFITENALVNFIISIITFVNQKI